jgi:hypothetical protein
LLTHALLLRLIMQDGTQQRIVDPLHAVVAPGLNDAFVVLLDVISVPTDEQVSRRTITGAGLCADRFGGATTAVIGCTKSLSRSG